MTEAGDQDDELILWAQEWANRKLFDGKDVKQLLAHEDMSFWWFFDFYIYNNLMKKVHGTLEENTRFKKRIAEPYLVARSLFRKFYGRLLMPVRRKRGASIIVMSHTVNWRKSKSGGKEDQLLGGIINELDRTTEYDVVALDRGHFFESRTLKEKRTLEPGRWTPIERYLTFGDIMEALEVNRQIRKRYKRFRDKPEFTSSFRMGDRDLYSDIIDTVDLAFKYIPMDAWLHIRALDNAIKRENVKAIVLSHEYGTYGKAAFIAARRNNVPTIAMQHGIIHKYHMGYVHDKEDIGPWGPEHCPMQDRMAVYGDFTKDILVKYGSYPPDSVIVVGQPKYDAISSPEKLYDRGKFRKIHGLDPGKRAVLLTTQPFPVMQYRIDFMKDMLAIANIPDIQIVIKPHPGEKAEWHLAILNEMGVKATVLDPLSDIYEAIWATDITATVSSTTAMEAIILGRDVFIYNTTGQEDPIPYVESGAAVGIYDKADLLPGLKKMLEDPAVRESLARGREAFIQCHIYKLDGRSTDRFVELILRTAGKQ